LLEKKAPVITAKGRRGLEEGVCLVERRQKDSAHEGKEELLLFLYILIVKEGNEYREKSPEGEKTFSLH